jgi:hypothetical protein
MTTIAKRAEIYKKLANTACWMERHWLSQKVYLYCGIAIFLGNGIALMGNLPWFRECLDCALATQYNACKAGIELIGS